MAREFAKSFYNSKAWQRCRQAYIAYRQSIDGGICERCSKKGQYNIGKEVHHKTYLTPENINDPNISLSFDNLELLCESCHSHEHMGEGSVTREGLIFDEAGNLVEAGIQPPI